MPRKIVRKNRGKLRARNRRWGTSDYVKAAGTALAAYKGVMQLKQIVNSELKHYDETGTINPDGSTGSIIGILRGLTQGDSNNTFNGNSILLKAAQLRFTVNLHASATATRVRMMLLRDTRPLTALPALTDIVSSATINAFMNIDDQIQRFRILKQKFVLVNTDFPEKVVSFYRWFKRCHCKFNDSQVPVLNDIIFLCYSDESTNVPAVTYQTRLRYYDN